ncbi:FKBP12-interacting protein of 37 kDa isoform X1 [Arachis ipaensis]|uniref:FKBP12-interacting protein of 37 kDa isoform X1 n=1 Tax=Arachis ipaensis TaxID=130454 RepID=UPI000A2B85D9|nr:FKBP12-interacting protein of 37 kDa isoform X1 [Arachis ipaensis]
MAEQPSSAEAVTEGAPELLPKEKDSEGGEGGNEQGQQGKASEGEERASESPCETESQRAVMKSSDKPLKGSNSGTLAAESPVVNNLLLPYLGFLKSMASSPHFDDQDFDFEGGFSGTRSAEKRPSPDYDDEYYDNDPFAPKKAKSKAEEAASGVTTGMILSLRESLQNCKDTLLTCQNELEAAKSEIHKWRTAFQNEPFIPSGTTPAPKLAINYLQALKSSEESLKEQLEKAKKKEGAFFVTFAKREQEIAELKVVCCAGSESSTQASNDAVLPKGSRCLHDLNFQARRLLLDPAVHEEFTRLKNLVEEKDKKMKELQDNIAAINFTPQSKMGKMLMAKCKTLQEENEEIGNQATDAKIQELAMKLSLQKYQNAELRSQFEGLQTHMDGLTNDVERSNEMVLMLQEKLEDKDQEIQRLKDELQEKGFMDEGTTEAASKERCH